MTKDIYLNFLGQLLREHYNSIKETGSAPSDSQQFINGYLTAARKLNAVYQKELNDYAARIHYEVFNMTIEERKKSLQIKPDQSEDEPENPVETGLSEEDELDVPAYRRKGIKLKFWKIELKEKFVTNPEFLLNIRDTTFKNRATETMRKGISPLLRNFIEVNGWGRLLRFYSTFVPVMRRYDSGEKGDVVGKAYTYNCWMAGSCKNWGLRMEKE